MRFLIIWVVLVRSVFSIHCPEYCNCHMQDEYRYVGCVNKGLISIDLDVPTSVQWLQLTNNSIHFLKNYAFSDLKMVDIQRLDLNRNSLSTIDHAAFEGMNVLEILDLSYNHLYQLDPRTFERILTLRRLDLSSNPLRTLPEPFLVSSSLESLYLKNTYLGYLPPKALFKMHSLRMIDLSSNQLIQLSTASVQNLSNLAQIYLSGNDIKCDRYTALTEELRNNGIRLYGVDCSSYNKSKSLLPSTIQINHGIKVHEKFQRIIINPKLLDKPILKPAITEINKYPSPVINKTSTTTVKPTTASNVTKLNNHYSSWIIVIIFFTGFLLGAFVAYTSVGLYSLYWRCQKRRIRSNRRDFDNLNLSVVTRTTHEPLIRNTIMCPTTTADPFAPPPPYNQLFGTCPRRFN